MTRNMARALNELESDTVGVGKYWRQLQQQITQKIHIEHIDYHLVIIIHSYEAQTCFFVYHT